MTTDRPRAARYSIRAQLLALMAVVVLPLAAMLAYAVYADARNEIRQARYQVRTLAELVASDVSHTLESSRDILRKLSLRPLVRQADSHRCDPALADLRESYPGFADLGVIDTAGDVICSAVAKTGEKAISVARMEWFARAIREDRFIAGKPMIGPITGKWVSVLAYPLHDDREKLIGLVVLPLDLAAYLPGVSNALLAADATVEILTADGTVVWRNRDMQRWVGMKREGAHQPGRLPAGPQGEWEGIGMDAVNKFFAVSPVALADWHVQVGVPSGAIYAQAVSGAIRNSLLGLLCLMGIAGLALLLGRRIAAPIQALAATARAIRAGRSGSRAAQAGARETVELAGEFNRMLDHLMDANNTLLAEQGLSQAIIETSPVGITIYDANGDCIVANPAMARHLGADLAGLLAQNYHRIESWKQSGMYQLAQKALESGEPQAQVVHLVTSFGKDVWLDVSFNALHGGTKPNLMHMASNLSAIKLTQEALEASEVALMSANQRLEMIIQSSPLAIYTRDLDGIVTSWNPAAERMFGWSAAEIVGQPLLTVPVGKQGETDSLRRRVLDGESIVQSEVRRQRKDGSAIDISTTLAPLRNIAGRTSGYLAIAADISERRKAEESMRLAALVYESSSEAMMVTDADGTIVAINPAFTAQTGYPLEEVIGRNQTILASGRHDRAFFQAILHALNTSGQWQGEIWIRRKNAELYPNWFTFNTTFNEDGTVYRRVALFNDITDKKKSEELIWEQANFDILTRLPNRGMFQDRLDQEIKKAHRAGLPMALMLIDLDRFKEVNDTLGHDIGDILLKEAAQRLCASVRETDTVARLGGDEFTVILSELHDTGSIERVTQSILRKLAEPFRLGIETVYISASIGITLYPEDATGIEVLLKNADQAMYAAKRLGRNRSSYFTPSMQEAAQARMRLASDLRGAIADDQFRLVYQPIVELASGTIHKAEALIRWQHPTRGPVDPVDFIPIAEETGLIVAIGDWVFRQAAREAVRWRATHHPRFQVSVNVSPVQINNENALSGWFGHLRELGLSGQSMVAEITEGLLMDASPATTRKLLEFRDQGIQVSIDDFGTGYSSLSYLKKFDIDYLKIDQSFVRNLAPASSDLALCEAIIVMAHKLGLKVIAEGVETEAQCGLLAVAGCDYGQGYLFSRPVPAGEFEKLLELERQNAGKFSI